MQANSFVRDVTGQVRSTGEALSTVVSDEARRLVASNEELATAFAAGFGEVDSTLRWGMDRLAGTIDELTVDFNYQAGLLLEQLRMSNRLLEGVISKLDAIHQTLENPTWTRAREFYRKGCILVSKSILDKAVEAFRQAEGIDDTNFFVQYELGYLYLYGVDDDENVIDLPSAKKHMLAAARYAKGEMTVDPSFSKYAAKAFFHASVAAYGMSGDIELSVSCGGAGSLIREASDSIEHALGLCPDFPEAHYHGAKYAALAGNTNDAIHMLESAIHYDWRYAIKADIDRAFDPVRAEVVALHVKLRSEALKQVRERVEIARKAVRRAEDSGLWESEAHVRKARQHLSTAESYVESDSATYSGLLAAMTDCQKVIEMLEEATSPRGCALRKELDGLMGVAAYLLLTIDPKSCAIKEKETVAAAEACLEEIRRSGGVPLMRAVELAREAARLARQARSAANEAENPGMRFGSR
jgi:tetratricopeptide (TPR) repeat protein